MTNLNFNDMAKVAISKKLCKEYHNGGCNNAIVYLNNGDEFQIQLFNPTSSVVGVKIKFNDISKKSDNIIVLRPGERIWLERFFDISEKFVFNTYEVSNSTQILEAIKDNGGFSVEFFYEKETYDYVNINTDLHNPYIYKTTYQTYQPLFEQTYQTYCNSGTYTSNITGMVYNPSITSSTTTYSDKRIETGRVEHGSHSNQTFKNVFYNFNEYPFYTKYINLIPMSRKQYSDNDIKKMYCTNCGKKLSPKFKYCPACGTKIIQ
jgi:hypothetical protein